MGHKINSDCEINRINIISICNAKIASLPNSLCRINIIVLYIH